MNSPSTLCMSGEKACDVLAAERFAKTEQYCRLSCMTDSAFVWRTSETRVSTDHICRIPVGQGIGESLALADS